jgi:ATP-dependent RNA helicase RhlE
MFFNWFKKTKPQPESEFYGMGIAPKLLEALDRMKFTVPTPIQKQAIPVACEGKDIAGIAQTGTGKTIAFTIPMIQTLAAKTGKGLILVPTRELAVQVNEVVLQFAPSMGMHTAVLIGGEPMPKQLRQLQRKPRIIIATPGRMIDHIQHGTATVNDVSVLVLDEADRMLDMGFQPQIERILQTVPKIRQTMLFSATLPQDVMRIASSYMKLPVRIEVARSGTAPDKVKQELYIVSKPSKNKLLAKLLKKYGGSVLLFVRTRHNAQYVTRMIRDMKHSVAEIHSDRTLVQRREALEGFKSGKFRILVATDIAARGIDVMGIELVLNYDLPEDEENYIHRIGRTGRAGQSGHAITFAMPDQKDDVERIERLMRIDLPVMTHPDIPSEKFSGFSRRRGLDMPPGFVPPKSLVEQRAAASRKHVLSNFCRGGRKG